LKLQHLLNKVLLTTGDCPRRKPTGELHVVLNIPYAYDFITQLCRQQRKVIGNQANATVPNKR